MSGVPTASSSTLKRPILLMEQRRICGLLFQEKKRNHPPTRDKTFLTNIVARQTTLQNSPYAKLTVNELKAIARKKQLRVGGKKQDLRNRLDAHEILNSAALKLQNVFRRYIINMLNKYRGNVLRKQANNERDFLTDDLIADIPCQSLFSYKEATDGFSYSFHLKSIIQLVKKADPTKIITNPYNRSPIPAHVLKDLLHTLELTRVFKIPVDITYRDLTDEMSNRHVSLSGKNAAEAITVFQEIDMLGNYTNSEWFTSLTRHGIIRFVCDMYELWMYRASITEETKRKICPSGNPFRSFINFRIHHEHDIEKIKYFALSIIKDMTTSGISNDDRTLGAMYVLAALARNSTAAAQALPWLIGI